MHFMVKLDPLIVIYLIWKKQEHLFAILNFVNHYPYLIANANLKFNVNEW